MFQVDTFRQVEYHIEEEGMDYTFKCYSLFEGIEDHEFHRLRVAYLEASDALEAYVYSRASEEEDEEDLEEDE